MSLTWQERKWFKEHKNEIKDRIAFELNCLCFCPKHKPRYYFVAYGDYE
jgi:hypothetical protein